MRSGFVASIVAVAVASVAFMFLLALPCRRKKNGCLGGRLGFGSVLR
jgi:hypothetical protein